MESHAEKAHVHDDQDLSVSRRRFLELVADTDIRAQPDSSTGSAIADDVLRIPGDLRTKGTRPGATNERSR